MNIILAGSSLQLGNDHANYYTLLQCKWMYKTPLYQTSSPVHVSGVLGYGSTQLGLTAELQPRKVLKDLRCVEGVQL
jgi:hypothetical protein